MTPIIDQYQCQNPKLTRNRQKVDSTIVPRSKSKRSNTKTTHHNNNITFLFPNHGPEISNSFGEGTLSVNVFLIVISTWYVVGVNVSVYISVTDQVDPGVVVARDVQIPILCLVIRMTECFRTLESVFPTGEFFIESFEVMQLHLADVIKEILFGYWDSRIYGINEESMYTIACEYQVFIRNQN